MILRQCVKNGHICPLQASLVIRTEILLFKLYLLFIQEFLSSPNCEVCHILLVNPVSVRIPAGFWRTVLCHQLSPAFPLPQFNTSFSPESDLQQISWEYPVYTKLLQGNMTSAAQQLLSACPPCCWLHPWALGHATYVLGDLFLLHPSRTDALEPLFAFFSLWQKTIVLLPLLENWPLMSHQAHALLTTVCSFGPFLSSLLLPSSSGKSSNSSTHSHRQNFFSPRERKMYLVQFLGPVVGTTHVQLRVTTWMEDFLKQILSEIVTVSLKHRAKSFMPNERRYKLP